MSALRPVLGVATGIALFLVTGEVAARIALSSDAFLQRVDTGTSSSRRITTIARVSALGRMPFFDSDSVRFDPRLGHTSRPMDAEMEDAGQAHRYRVDDAYRRLTAPPDWRPGHDAPTVAVLGDSFAFGDEVGDADTFAWKLREATGARVLNHGTLGYGLDQMWLQWGLEVAPEHPEVTVVLLTGAAVVRTGMPWDNWAKPWVRLDGDTLRLGGQPVPPPETFLPSWASPRLDDVIALWRARRQLDAEVRTAIATAPAVLDALAEDVTAAFGTLVVVYGPVPAEYEPGADARTTGTHDQVFVPWCERATTAIRVDLLDVFRETAEAGVPLTRVNHWTPAGHDLVADALALVLREEGLLGPTEGDD